MKLTELLQDYWSLLTGMRPKSLTDGQTIVNSEIRLYINRLESILLGMLIGNSVTVEELRETMKKANNPLPEEIIK